MGKLELLPADSQSGCEVLYFDAGARPTDLWECANRRLAAVRKLLETLSEYNNAVDLDGLPVVADACSLLMSDAQGMMNALFTHLRDYELSKIGEYGKIPGATTGEPRHDG